MLRARVYLAVLKHFQANINIVHLHTEELFLLSLYAVGHLVAKEICGRKPCHRNQLV